MLIVLEHQCMYLLIVKYINAYCIGASVHVPSSKIKMMFPDTMCWTFLGFVLVLPE